MQFVTGALVLGVGVLLGSTIVRLDSNDIQASLDKLTEAATNGTKRVARAAS